MSWAHPFDTSRTVTRHALRLRELPLASRTRPAAPAGLGTANAGRAWAWSEAPRRTNTAPELRVSLPDAWAEPVLVRVPSAVLREMAQAARLAGRGEGELWAEAAREWLTRRTRGDEPLPPTPAAAALPVPRPPRSWSAIDSVLRELRVPHQPRRLPATPETPVTAPAA